MQVIEGNIRATGKKFAIVVSRFNSFVVESLLEGALDTLERHGEVSDVDITLVRVPGAYELPVVAKKLAEKKSVEIKGPLKIVLLKYLQKKLLFLHFLKTLKLPHWC